MAAFITCAECGFRVDGGKTCPACGDELPEPTVVTTRPVFPGVREFLEEVGTAPEGEEEVSRTVPTRISRVDG